MTGQVKGVKRFWHPVSKRINALAVRERAFLLVTGLTVLLVGVGQFWLAPTWQAWSESVSELRTVEAQTRQLNAELEGLNRQLSVHPDEPVRKQLQALEVQLAQEKARLEKALSGLVSPVDMVPVLQRVLARADNLALLALEKRPVRPVRLEEEQPESAAILFEHAVNMTLRGRYFDVLNYLKALEAESGVLVLRAMNYEVKEYPVAEVSLTFSTLSLDPAWLAL